MSSSPIESSTDNNEHDSEEVDVGILTHAERQCEQQLEAEIESSAMAGEIERAMMAVGVQDDAGGGSSPGECNHCGDYDCNEVESVMSVKSNDNDESSSWSDSDESCSEEDATVSRWDVSKAIRAVSIPGDICSGGPASCPNLLGLRIDGVGDVSLPVIDFQAKALAAAASPVVESSYFNALQIDAGKIAIENPSWDDSLKELLREASVRLGLNPSHAKAELQRLLIFEKGGYVRKCRNVEMADDVLGTLTVQLPSRYTGGKVLISHDERSEAFTLGAGSDAAFGCHYVSYYADCVYDMEPIQSGRRLALVYSLCHTPPYPAYRKRKPTAGRLRSSMAPLEQSLALLPRSDRMFLLPLLSKKHGVVSLTKKGIEALTGTDRGRAQATKVAGKGNWKLLIVEATRVDTQSNVGYDDSFGPAVTSHQLIRAFDEHGREASEAKEWIAKMIDFGSSETSGNGMMLAREVRKASNSDRYGDDEDSYMYEPSFQAQVSDTWGSGKTDSESQYGEHEGYLTVYRKTSYKSNFLLAYDVSSEFELKSLAPKGVEEASEQVSSTQNSDLLARLISVVQTKAKCKLYNKSCLLLLHMVIGQESAGLGVADETRISFAKSILASLNPAEEPNQELYNLILVAVESIGWRNIAGIVSQILARKRDLSLEQFLVRVDFLLELRGLTRDASSLLSTCFDLFSDPKMRLDTSAIVATIESMLKRHGWEQIQSAVEVSVDAMRAAHNRSFTEETTDGLLKRTDLLLKLYTAHRCAAVESYLCDAVKDFISKLEKSDAKHLNSYYRYNLIRQSRIDILSRPGSMKMVPLLFKHGTEEEFDRFGKWVSSEKLNLSLLIERIRGRSEDETEANSLASKLLNKCLLQHSTNWTKGSEEDAYLSCARTWRGLITITTSAHRPSAHVQKMLDEFPGIAKRKDGDGRLPMHHAVASGRACLDSIKGLFLAHPKGASMADPVTRLFPFMVAGSKGDVDASFELLLADPTLLDTKFGGVK